MSRKDNHKLAEMGTHTKGEDTGYGKRSQGGMWEVTEGEIEAVEERMVAILIGDGGGEEGKKKERGKEEEDGKGKEEEEEEEEENERFLVGDLPDFLEKCLTSTIDPPELVPRINSFLKRFLLVIIQKLTQGENENDNEEDKDLSAVLIASFHRIMNDDSQTTYFYDYYG